MGRLKEELVNQLNVNQYLELNRDLLLSEERIMYLRGLLKNVDSDIEFLYKRGNNSEELNSKRNDILEELKELGEKYYI